MKCLTTIVLAAGLGSAFRIPGLHFLRGRDSSALERRQLDSIANIFNGSSISTNISDSQFDPGSFGGSFGGSLNIDGLDLSSVDLSNQDSVSNANVVMLNALCLGGLFNLNNVLNLGGSANLQLFLQLAQLMELEQLGFLNIFDIQKLITSSVGFNRFGRLNAFNAFNIGFFKRAVDEHKKTLKRTKLRRGEATKTLGKRQCQTLAVDPNATIQTNVATQIVSGAPASTEVVASQSAVASQPAAATDAAAPASTDNSRLSDFTR